MSMKKSFILIGSILSALFIFLIGNVAAQIATNTLSDAEGLSNAISRVRANAANRHPTERDLEWASNAMANAKPPKIWPETSKKQEIFDHCVKILRASIDTNQIQIACSKLTNQPQAVLELRDLTKVAISNLDEFANLFTSPELSSDAGNAGYIARVYDQKHYYFLLFWSENGPLKQDEERTPDGQRILVSARFFENGNLMEFRINSPERKGLAFKQDGELDYYW